jgi:glycosyltransferase involved in cell wall biosynthesis
MLLKALPEEVHVTHIPTMVDGGKWIKAVTFAGSLAKLAFQLRHRPDVVHIHFASGASNLRKVVVAQMALARGASVIMHAHGGNYQRHWARMSRIERAATQATLLRVHRLVVLGDAWRRFFESIGVPAHRIVVLPNPVALPPTLPARPAGATIRFVYLGLIAQRKGVFDLIEAVAKLSPENRARARFVVAGSGETQQLRELVAKREVADIVEVREWIEASERDRLLASAHAFVLPSHTEGLPMSLLEAMAWGLAPICTPVGSIPEYVVDGANGLVVAPGNVQQLASAIESMIAQDARRTYMGRLARATVEPLCVKKYSTRVCALYRSLAHNNPRSLAAR